MSAIDQPTVIHTKQASRVTWLSFCSACLAWMFDTMDLQIFNLVLFPSVSDFVETAKPGVVVIGWKLLV
jgi:hypothetical protein